MDYFTDLTALLYVFPLDYKLHENGDVFTLSISFASPPVIKAVCYSEVVHACRKEKNEAQKGDRLCEREGLRGKMAFQ